MVVQGDPGDVSRTETQGTTNPSSRTRFFQTKKEGLSVPKRRFCMAGVKASERMW